MIKKQFRSVAVGKKINVTEIHYFFLLNSNLLKSSIPLYRRIRIVNVHCNFQTVTDSKIP